RCATSFLVYLALSAAIASGQQTATAPAFRFERPIVTSGAGPRRLPVDVPLLAGAAPYHVVSRTRDSRTGALVFGLAGGLTDLRIYDASGAEVGYLLVGTAAPPIVYQAGAILPVSSLDTDTEKTSGFEADLGELMVIDRF